jgi:hypothetical protein
MACTTMEYIQDERVKTNLTIRPKICELCKHRLELHDFADSGVGDCYVCMRTNGVCWSKRYPRRAI